MVFLLFDRSVRGEGRTKDLWKIDAKGLINGGNTCYLNASLQVLFQTPALANWLSADDQHRKMCGECVICGLAYTLIAMQQSLASDPIIIRTKLNETCNRFERNQQEDAHEFQIFLLESTSTRSTPFCLFV